MDRTAVDDIFEYGKKWKSVVVFVENLINKSTGVINKKHIENAAGHFYNCTYKR